mmetsp:Transcript_42245/g.78207  ORF Transcript_42245/g.78207 Transcript_42245/m.78207 type:complete len:186 (-) Transcript_42245:81-638(-)
MSFVSQSVGYSSDSADHPKSQPDETMTEHGLKRKRERTAEEKRLDRIMANRRSARESRERRKLLMENLEGKVNTLKNENDKLARENGILRGKLSALMAVHTHRMQANTPRPSIPATFNPLPPVGMVGVKVRAPTFPKQPVVQARVVPDVKNLGADAKDTLLLAVAIKKIIESQQQQSLSQLLPQF